MTPRMRPDPGRAWDVLSKYRGHQELLGGQGFLQLAAPSDVLRQSAGLRGTQNIPQTSSLHLRAGPFPREISFPQATRESGMGPSGLQRYKQALTTGMGTGVWGGLWPQVL